MLGVNDSRLEPARRSPDTGPAAPSLAPGEQRARPRRVAVIGAGITGLATAFRLERERPSWEVVVFEAEPHVGGKIRTAVRDGYTVDWGPNGFLASAPETLRLVRDLGLEEVLQPAATSARKRYLYLDGGLRTLPATPPAFLASEVVPLHGRLRAALEIVLATAGAGEESVHAFLARHFGRVFADALADAFVSGIAAGDPRELSLDALFPRLRAMERTHRSLVLALIAQQRAARYARVASAAPRGATEKGASEKGAAPKDGAAPTRGLTSFRDGGMQRLLDALRGALRGGVRLAARVEALEPRADGHDLRVAGASTGPFDDVVLTVPAPAAAALLRPHLPAAAEALAAIPYAGIRVFGLGFDRIDVPRALDGFGFLAARGQGVRSLGVLWTSSLYPDRAPVGKVLLRVLAGGRLDPSMLELTGEDALAAVRRDLRVSMGITVEPEFVEAVAWQ